MMHTPIYDFARNYADSDAIRMHMPGHKGKVRLGCEPLDLTEISGADELFAPESIIAESEANASEVFGCRTVYSAEGASLCIRAMLYLAVSDARAQGRKPVIAAARNVHKTFLTAAALLDFEILWLPQQKGQSYLCGCPTAAQLAETYENAPEKPCALYLTSPDYLGHTADIRAAADFCHAHGMRLLTDAAHGAYLHFLPQPQHPADLGADLCCTSAHKTLPVLTGGAYLHIGNGAPTLFAEQCKAAMALFASTSPSYLIMESLDLCNAYLHDSFSAELRAFLPYVQRMKQQLAEAGFALCGDEPMKVTLMPKSYGYTGTALAEILQNQHIYVEFADPDYLVLMMSPQTPPAHLQKVTDFLCKLPRRRPITALPPELPQPEFVMTPREVMLAPKLRLPAGSCIGKVCAEFTVSCPPAVPIVMCGERISAEAAACFAYYGCESCTVAAE